MVELVLIDIAKRKRDFVMAAFGFKVDVFAPVDAVIVGRRLLFEIGVGDACPFGVIDFDDVDRRRPCSRPMPRLAAVLVTDGLAFGVLM